MIEWAWLIPVLPLAAWLLISLFGNHIPGGKDKIGILAMFIAFVLSVGTLVDVIQGERLAASLNWVVHGDTAIRMGYSIDPLASIMLVVVTFVSLMVHLFSLGYMHGDIRYKRYYALLSFFTFSMLGLILADNFLLLFIFWELVGLASYYLIGHWFEKEEVTLAAMKAFLTTRVGDIGMLIGILILFFTTQSFGFADVQSAVLNGQLTGTLLSVAVILIFLGAVGKSAQFPLHAWLPDAMAGPTPVSALIHAATMVAAGVYLVARGIGIFEASDTAMATVAWIGGFTAVFAASMGLVMEDIKKVLAYSTVSQLGFMMLGLGAGGYVAGVFHLTTHAFFKALLFLASGSVIHAVQTQNMHQMGGLRSKLPITFLTWTVGALALAGVPPFAGFFSKDEIMLAAWHSPFRIPFWMALVAAAFTAFYIARATFLTFFGRPRDKQAYDRAHESPAVMTVPLILLAVLALGGGLINSSWAGHWFGHFLVGPHGEAAPPGSSFVVGITQVSWVVGLLLAWAIYGTERIALRRSIISALRPAWALLKNRYYFDDLYGAVARGTVGFAKGITAFDRDVVDGLVDGVGAVVSHGSKVFRRLQTGFAQGYAIVLFFGLIVALFFLVLSY